MKRFSCGCSFETDAAGSVIFSPDITQLPLTCEATWDMISEGNTKGVFQLESQLGRSMASQTQPRNIQELSDLVAIIRPGCMERKSRCQLRLSQKSSRMKTFSFAKRTLKFFNTCLSTMKSQKLNHEFR